jgi:hypothetical protein
MFDFGQTLEFIVLSILFYLGLKTYFFSENNSTKTDQQDSQDILRVINKGIGEELYQPISFERTTTVKLDLQLLQNGTFGNAVVEKMDAEITCRGFVRINPKDICITSAQTSQNAFVVGVTAIDVVFSSQQVVIKPNRNLDITEILASKVCNAYQQATNYPHLVSFNLNSKLVLDDLHLKAIEVLGHKLKDLADSQIASFGFAQELPTDCNILYVDGSGSEISIRYHQIQDACTTSVQINSSLVDNIIEKEISRTPLLITENTPNVSVNLLAPIPA